MYKWVVDRRDHRLEGATETTKNKMASFDLLGLEFRKESIGYMLNYPGGLIITPSLP